MFELIFTNSRGESIKLFDAPFRLVSFQGLGDVEANNQTQKAPYQDGTTLIDTTLEEKPITIEVKITGKDEMDLAKNRRMLSSIFNPKLGEGILKRISVDGVHQINATSESVPFFPDGPSNRRGTSQKALISLLCPNPYWKEIQDTEESLTSWLGLFEFPFEFPIEFGEKANRASIINYGDVETPVIIQFHGPATSPIVLNESTGYFIKVNRTLTKTDILEVNTAFGINTVEIVHSDGTRTNAYNYISLDSDVSKFRLQLGENVLSYSSDDTDQTGIVSIKYRNQYSTV